MLCIATLGYAQTIIDLGTGAAGTLSTKVTDTSLTTLTVKGEIDARDFVFIKTLENLQTLDLQDANIMFYEGEGGTMGPNDYYEANHLPAYAFKESTLTKLVFPKSLVAVDYTCLFGTDLEEMDFSNTKLETIVGSAISQNKAMKSISLPATLKKIDNYGISFNNALTEFKVAVEDPTKMNVAEMFGVNYKYDYEKNQYVKDDNGNMIVDYEYAPPADCVLYVPAGKTEAYKALKPWSLFSKFEEFSTGNPDLTTPELKFENETVIAKVGDAPFKNTLTNPENVTVTYASSNEKVATVDAEGLLTILASGVTTITVTSEATDKYNAATASFQLTVQGAEGTATGNVVDMGTGAAGTLSTKVTDTSLTTLTVKGEIDARDFVFIKTLENLQTLDLQDASIVYYQGEGGTMGPNDYYEANHLPTYAFKESTLTKIVFPKSLVALDYMCLYGTDLEEMDFSNTKLETIVNSTISQNKAMKSISLPATLKEIGNFGISFNNALTEFKVAVEDPTKMNVAEMFGVNYKYDYEKNQYVKDDNGNMIVDYEYAPPADCVLYVPAGKTEAYKALKPWSLFSKFEEFSTGNPDLTTPELKFENETVIAKVGDAPFKNTLTNPENVTVTYASSNEKVATVDAEGLVTIVGPGEATITATSEATDKYNAATASFKLIVKSVATFKDGVVQMGTGAAGTLSRVIPEAELEALTELTIKGEIDARDFKFMRDKLTVQTLDLTDAVIVAYTGAEGTYSYGDENTEYEANHLPSNAFDGQSYFLEVIFPTSMEAVDYLALSNTKLVDLDFSKTQLKTIDSSSIERNFNLASITLPSTFKFAAERALANNPELKKFTCYVENPASMEIRGIFGIEYEVNPDTNEYVEVDGEYVVKGITPAPDNCILYVPEASVELYKANEDWNSLFETILPIGGSSSIKSEVAQMPLQVAQGALCVNATAMVRVYDVTGKLVHQQNVEGEAQIALRSGLYIIQMDGKAQRVVIP